jgi:CHAD domain-containing protein
VRAGPIELDSDATLKEAIVPIARSCLAQISQNAALAFDGLDPEGVHQMRVGVRRMRALITLVRLVVPSIRLGRLRGPLRWLAGTLGDVRDVDVFVEERLEPHLARRQEDLGLAGLREAAVALREERRMILREALHSSRTARLLLELGHWIATTEEQDFEQGDPSVALARRADHFAQTALARLHRKANKRAPAALAGDPTERHELRIALKKLRYACEFFSSLFDAKDASRYLRRLQRLQDLLGVQNDLETSRQVLQQLLDRSEPEQLPERARSAGFIEGWAEREQEKAMRKLARQWSRFESTRPFWVEK